MDKQATGPINACKKAVELHERQELGPAAEQVAHDRSQASQELVFKL